MSHKNQKAQNDPVSFARQYAEYLNVPMQGADESDEAFRRRISEELLRRNQVVESQEVLYNAAYTESAAVMNSLVDVLKSAMGFGNSFSPQFEYPNRPFDARMRVGALLNDGAVGKDIAEALLAEGVTIEAAATALYDHGFVVRIMPYTTDVSQLHVSDMPMSAGLSAIIASSESRALPSVIWKRKGAEE